MNGGKKLLQINGNFGEWFILIRMISDYLYLEENRLHPGGQ
ncbi:MAG TPA: hypothetical protein VK809_08595 [Bacteroidia bacterium]|nr:hypothetical protein [Bacteroidia bacterium]